MDDRLAFLSGEEEPEAEVIEEQIADDPEPEGEIEAAPPAAPEEKPQHSVPITAMLDEREKRQAAERRAAELEQRMRFFEQAQQKKPEMPDVFENPQGFTQHVNSTVTEAMVTAHLNMSEMLARDKFGDDEVNAAVEAVKAAGLQQHFVSQRNPYGELVKWHRQQKVAQEIGSDPDAWRAKERAALAEQIRQEVLAELQGQQQPARRPPASLASAPAAGKSNTPISPGTAFDAAFGR